VEAQALSSVATALHVMGEQRQRSLDLYRQAVALWHQILRTAAPGPNTRDTQGVLADQLSTFGAVLTSHGPEGMAEAEACLREALALSDSLSDLWLAQKILSYLINLCGEAGTSVRPAEAEAFRSQLNQCLVQMGRSPETSCSICLESLSPPAGGAAEDAAGSGGSGPSDSCVRALACDHQFHHGCLTSWGRKTASRACPLCKR